MIRHQPREEILSGGFAESGAFSIKSGPKAFKILSSNIYSNKIEAVIRELSTNAADAQIEAGTTNVPFEIRLPDRFDPSFYIRDYGTGLSHAQVMKLYVTYFDSTKETSNDFAGTLGLGSKSPFSYINSFNVTSFHEGKKRLYTAYISQSGLPEIVFASETNTEEPNGLMVSFPTKKEDTSAFQVAARRILTWFDAPFVISNYPDLVKNYKDELKALYKGSNYFVHNSYGYKGAHIKQGPILYSVSSSDIKNYFDESEQEVLGKNIVIDVPMGEVDFEPGRENLSFDKNTVANIKKHVAKIRGDFVSEIHGKIRELSSDWEKFVYITFKLKKEPFFLASSADSVVGYKIDGNITIPEGVEIRAFESGRKTVNDKFTKKNEIYSSAILGIGTNARSYYSYSGPNVTFYTYTKNSPYLTRFIDWCDKENGVNSRRIIIAGTEKDVRSVLKQWGNPPAKNLNNILSPIAGGKRKQTTVQTINFNVHLGDTFSKYNNTESIAADISSLDGYYLLIPNFTTGYTERCLTSVYDNSVAGYWNIRSILVPWIPLNKKVYLIRTKDAEKAKSNKKLLAFDEYLDPHIQTYIKENVVSFDNNARPLMGTVNIGRFKDIDLSKVHNEITRQRIADLVYYSDKLSAMNVARARKLKHFYTISKRITETDFDSINNSHDIIDRVKTTSAYFSRYKMLQYLTYTVDHDIIIEYLNIVDKTLAEQKD
jgi:hypothetical protein